MVIIESQTNFQTQPNRNLVGTPRLPSFFGQEMMPGINEKIQNAEDEVEKVRFLLSPQKLGDSQVAPLTTWDPQQ